jgi:hypothetical protein
MGAPTRQKGGIGMSKGGINKLSAKTVEAAVRAGLKKKLFDGGGLYLEVLRPGRRSWRYKFRIDGKENRISLGTTDDVSLAQAREIHKGAHAQVSQGRCPQVERKIERASKLAANGQTFDKLAERWLSQMKTDWSKIHYTKSARAFERDLLPTLGKLPVSAITPQIIASVIAPIQTRAPETACRIRQHLRSVFDQALVEGLVQQNTVVMPRRGAAKLTKRKHPAITDVVELGGILRKLEGVSIAPAMREATYVLTRTAVRIGELVPAQWSEFDLDAGVWRIPRDRMKMKSRPDDHEVPLPASVVERLKTWRASCPSK